MLWKTRLTSDLNKPLLNKSLLMLAAGALCALPIAASAQTSSASAPPVTSLRKSSGLKTAVVAATDTGGDADIALRALKATNIAMARSAGYSVVPATMVASNMRKAGLRYPFAPRDYEIVRRNLDKAMRVVAVTVSPADMSDANATYKAIVEMYDTNNGGLVGRGEATYTATPDSEALVSMTTTTVARPAPANSEAVLGSFPVPAGTATTATAAPATTTTTIAAPVRSVDETRFLAVDGAVLRAVAQMTEPAVITGIVVSKPMQHMARLSMGEMHGLRNGSRIEYLAAGIPIAYGTVVDVGKGDALATVAPERAFPFLDINSDWRTSSIPSAGAAGLNREQIDEKEWKKFESSFGIGAAIVGLAYLLIVAN